MVDPKVVELGVYNGIPHLLIPVVTDPRKAAGALQWAVVEMTNRYKLFADNNVRDIKSYNLHARENDMEELPQIVIIIDELADLMMVAPSEVEDSICRLAQMARAAGMHLVIATQRPSVDVITGLIKANIPSRISFAVSSYVDSRTIIDMGGAEKLLGRGDMLYYPMGASKPQRVQGAFVDDREVEKIVSFVKNQNDEAEYNQDVIEQIENAGERQMANENRGSEADELLPQAVEMAIEAGQASVAMYQRRLKIGYQRAARLIDQMEQRKIIGQFEGTKPREVLITRAQWNEMLQNLDIENFKDNPEEE
jgi:S-DNA-T family DNA segregation ATPase FtsK/SpoIIIE